MKNVVFYGRYSSSNQTEQSIEGQLHVCQRYAEQNGLQIVGQYIDRAMTGTNDNRPEFQRMIADSRHGGFEGVLVYRLDRFARNSLHAAIYKQKLQENGVRILSATENLTDTPEGRMLEGFLISINQFYSEELSQKVNRGLSESFAKGYYLKKIPPFGYQIIDRKLVPDETTAPVAREIFERYNAGQRIVDIVQWLNSLGMVNQKGNAWKPMNVSTHLNNRTYKGEYFYGQFPEPMPCAALVTPELFDSVQEKLKASPHRSRRRSDYRFILSGKLKCAYCGHSVSGSTSRSENHYYYCRHCEKENRQCIPADFLHEKVFSALDAYLTPEKADELASAAYEAYLQEQTKDVRPALQKELAAVENKLKRAIDAVLDGLNSPALTASIHELEARKASLQTAVAEAPVPMPKLKKEHFVFLLRRMAELDGTELLNTIVNSIYIKGEKVVICINLTDEDNDPPMEQVLFKLTEGDGINILNNISSYPKWILIAA